MGTENMHQSVLSIMSPYGFCFEHLSQNKQNPNLLVS